VKFEAWGVGCTIDSWEEVLGERRPVIRDYDDDDDNNNNNNNTVNDDIVFGRLSELWAETLRFKGHSDYRSHIDIYVMQLDVIRAVSEWTG
jgi:hypothetical protein